MPLHPNVRRCTHIKVTGHRCGSPALKQEYFCYFHTRMIKGVQTRVDSEIHPVALIENPEAIQAAIMHMIDAVLKGAIDNKRATIVLKALYIAVRNSRNVYFHIRQDDMVREVPNYAHQYLTEHPEVNPTEPNATEPNTHAAPDTLALPAGQSSPLKKSHPERACTSRESKDLHPASTTNAATGNSPRTNPPDTATTTHQAAAQRRKNAAHGASRGNNAKHNKAPEERKNQYDDTTPPFTTRQSERWDQIKKLEACVEGAMRGNWRDLRTVFNAAGLTPRTPPASPQVAPSEKEEAT